MARVYGIKKKLSLNNVDEKIIKEIIGNEDLVDVIVRMEKLLDPDMMNEILDSCACGGGQLRYSIGGYRLLVEINENSFLCKAI